MKEDKFIKDNAPVWKNLEETLNKLKSKGLKKIERNELEGFISNYNLACAHLSYSRTNFGSTNTTEYLNRLVSSAHSYIYTAKSSTFKNLIKFFLWDFPTLVRQNSKLLLLSTSFFLLGTLLSFVFTAISPENAAAFLPQNIVENINFENNSSAAWEGPVESTFILTNNIRVGFLAFSFGVTLGIGTAWVLIYNGFMLGTLGALAYLKGYNLKFWSLILPHGVLELFAIFVCGAAGLLIGYALIHPGAYSRKDAFITHGKTAIQLVCGTIPIFFVAGFIEGFITPRGIAPELKLLFALLSLILLSIYLALPILREWRHEKKSQGSLY
ncbi:MAG: stage II sporulation protein M [Clostridia bacterium]|nr:stage II sporulation protein M [Clostridia bacterium]